VSEDRSWGADTVAVGRTSHEPSPAPSSARPARSKLPKIALRLLALVTVAIVAVVALTVAAGGGSDSRKAHIREVFADPAPSVVAKQAPRVPAQARRSEPRDGVKPHVRRADAGQLERKASAETQAQTAPEPPAESALDYVPPPPENVAPVTSRAPTQPTSPAAEFGL